MRRALMLASLVAALGCDNPRTEVVVVVDSSGLTVPRDLDALHVTVTDKALDGDAATLFDSQSVPLCRPGMSGGCYDVPISFTLVPGEQRPDDPVRVHVQALLGTQVVIDDAATFTFIKGSSARLDFILFAACLNTDCAASDRTCGPDGQCTSISPQPFEGEPDLSASPRPDAAEPADLAVDDLTTPPDLSTMVFCGDGNVDVTRDPLNCGGCGVVCPNPTPKPNTAALCTNQVCSVGCQTGWGDCNGGGPDGCEHDVSGDAQNCGACGHVCGNTNVVGGVGVCTSNACVFNCSPGTAHCSTSDATGCETTIATDSHNCGSCGFDCGSAACVNGFCRYTAGTENIQTQSSLSVLVQDAASLYWFGDTCGGTHVIRTVNKDGTGLADVWASSKIGCPDQGATLAVDKNYLYFFNDTYKSALTKGVKTGVQDPALVLNTGAASGTGVFLDTDASANAKYVFMTQALNGPGLYRVDLANPAWTPIYTSGDARGMTRFGNTLYFGALLSHQIQYLDMYAATPTVKVLGTLGSTSRGLATDGVNVYACGDDGSLYKVVIATGSASTIATGGPGECTLATDGVNVYVASGYLYRVPVNGSGAYSSYRWVDNTKLPGPNTNIFGVQLDATGVYFATYGDIFKTRK